MRRLGLKVGMFALLFLGMPAVVGRGALRWAPQRFDPRLRVLYEHDLQRYQAVLLGSSVFSSHYVDREDQTLWSVLAREAGLSTFPAALNGARGGDLLAQARYLAGRLRPGAVVFVEVHPFNAWRRAESNYRSRLLLGGFVFDEPALLERAWNWAAQPLFADLLRARALVDTFGTGSFFKRGAYFDRTWDGDGEFARRRYRELLAAIRSGAIPETVDLGVLSDLSEILLARALRPAFVLTPVNDAQIDAYSPPGEAAEVRAFAERRRAATREFLAERQLPALDLSGAVPSSGFADLIHTNARGDAILGRELASSLVALPPAELRVAR